MCLRTFEVEGYRAEAVTGANTIVPGCVILRYCPYIWPKGVYVATRYGSRVFARRVCDSTIQLLRFLHVRSFVT